MSRLTRPLASLSMAALFSLGLAAGRPAAQQADTAKTATSKAIAQPKKAVGSRSGAFLEVRGEVGTPQLYSKEEFARLPRQTVKARGHDGVESQYEGVPLIALIDRAGAPSGARLKGRMALSLYLVVEAADGYRVVFALPELDPGYTDRTILLADRRDGKPLSDREGPLQVIVPGEKKHARWVRQTIRLVVGRA
jgi:DMSO/TMAO reductase YedYZ molybdopterin-dependent catalytic subunit